MASDDDLVTVAKFGSTPEAHIAQGVLEAENIPSVLTGEATNDALWYVGTAIGGVRLQVKQRDKQRAEQALDSARAKEPVRTNAPAKCPHCGAAVEPGFEVCWSCGAPIGDPAVDATSVAGSVASSPVATSTVTPLEPDDDAAESATDAMASRAWRSAIFGFIFPPLLLYANYLLAQLMGQPLSRAATRRFYGALVVVITALLFWWIVFVRR